MVPTFNFLNVGTVPTFNILNVGTVPMFNILNVGTVPTFKGPLESNWANSAHAPSPMCLRGRWRFLRGVLVVFEMLDTTRIHQGSCISIFKSFSWKVVHLLGSPDRDPSVILGVYEDTGGSYEEFWCFLA